MDEISQPASILTQQIKYFKRAAKKSPEDALGDKRDFYSRKLLIKIRNIVHCGGGRVVIGINFQFDFIGCG